LIEVRRTQCPGVVADALIPAGEGAVSPLPRHFVTEKGERITEGTLRRRLYVWVRESRLKKADIKPYDLRRTSGTWYLQENPGQLIELAELVGHSNLSQVRKYALSDAERAQVGIAKL
jgi:integrase